MEEPLRISIVPTEYGYLAQITAAERSYSPVVSGVGATPHKAMDNAIDALKTLDDSIMAMDNIS